MNRWRTWIVVGAVGIVAALAVGDALRGNGGAELSPQAGATTATRPPTLRETLRRQHVSGVIDYSDEQCALHSLLLPNLTDEIVRKEGTGAPVRRCAFAVGAGRFLADDELISPDRTRVARCRRGHVEVLDVLSGRLLSRTPGCVPAWRPNGGLTYAHDGAVLEDGRVLYAQGELRRLARRHPNIAFAGSGGLLRVRVLALAWLERRFLAASLRAVSRRVEPQSFVVLLRGNRFLALDAAFAGPVRTLVASPTGSFVAEDQGTIISKEGRSFGLLESVPRPRRVVFFTGRALARHGDRHERLPRRYPEEPGLCHPPSDSGAGSRLGAGRSDYRYDDNRSMRKSMKLGPSTSTPTRAFGSFPVRLQRST